MQEAHANYISDIYCYIAKGMGSHMTADKLLNGVGRQMCLKLFSVIALSFHLGVLESN